MSSVRSRIGMVFIAMAMVVGAAVGGALVGEVTGADASVGKGSKAVLVPMSPTRFLDTRGTPHGPIGVPVAGKLGARQTMDLLVAGARGLPSDASAVQLNVTTVNASAESFLTLYGSGTTRPLASTMNPDVGQTSFNGAVIPVGSNGAISIYNHVGSVDVIIDVTGYYVDHHHHHHHDDRYYNKEASNAKYLEGPPSLRVLGTALVIIGGYYSKVGELGDMRTVEIGVHRIDLVDPVPLNGLTAHVNAIGPGYCSWAPEEELTVDYLLVLCEDDTGARDSEIAFSLTVFDFDSEIPAPPLP